MILTPDCCPECGELARNVKAVMLCSVPLYLKNGEYHIDELGAGRAWKTARLVKYTVLECGGGHKWDATIEGEAK